MKYPVAQPGKQLPKKCPCCGEMVKDLYRHMSGKDQRKPKKKPE